MVRKVIENSKIVIIPNKYKDTFDNFIDNPDAKSLDWPRPIDKRLCKYPSLKIV